MLTLTFGEGGRPPDAAAAREVTTWRDEEGGVCARGFVGARRRWMDCPGLGVFAFDATSTVVHAWPAHGVSRDEVSDRFTRTLQPAILQGMGWQALHASAVASDEAVAALCGVSGSGKSTLAYALGRCGFRQFADDGLVLRVGPDGVFAHSLPFAPRLREAAARHFGEPFLSRVTPGRGAPLPVNVLFVLKQDARHSGAVRVEPLRPASVFPALVNHAHCFDSMDPREARRFVEDYLTVAGRVPAYTVGYHPGLSRLAEVLEAVSVAAAEHGVAPALQAAPALP
jgi:hypothetical protein